MAKKSLFLLLILFSLSQILGQNERPQYGLTAEDVLQWHRLSERMRTSTPPTAPVINIPEFSTSQGVLVAYPYGYYGSGFGIPNTLIAQMSQMVNVVIAVKASSFENTITQSLQSSGANMDNISFVTGEIDSYWTRDYGPWFIIDGNDEFGVIDFTYNRPARPDDDAHMAIMANYLNINHFDMPLVHTGGNYMTDGYGSSASTDLVFDENSDLTEAEIRQMCTDYLGIDNYHFTIDPQGDYIAHIDCWGKFLDVDKIMVAQLPVGDSRYQQYEDVANYFANATSAWGNKYQVFRVFEPGSVVSNAVTPYTNCLILNDHVFVPVTGASYDDDAIECYRNAMPGYTIVPIMQKNSTPWENTDALHCRTHEIPDLGMLLLRHYPTLGAQPFDTAFTLSADIHAYSGQSIIADSVRILYRIIASGDTSDWQSAPMHPVGGRNWEGNIGGISDTCEVQYYLTAADQSGRREFHPWIGQPDPHIFTVAPNTNSGGGNDNDDGTSHIASFLAEQVRIAPNPAHDQFTIQAPNAQQIIIYNAVGQVCLKENSDHAAIQCGSWSRGTYFAHIVGQNGQVVRKKIILQ